MFLSIEGIKNYDFYDISDLLVDIDLIINR